MVERDRKGKPAVTKPARLHANLLANPAQVTGFRDFERLLVAAGFVQKRERGSHKSWRHPAMAEVLTVQPKGKDAAPYQVRKFLDMMRRHGLTVED
jgi:predicted RNA binding protein YcfA (HicA-like mRNA interferase family)